MTSLKNISVLIVLFSAANPAWSATYDFCKVKKIYDENVNTPPQIIYEDCAGIGYLAYGKDLAKAYCWKDASDLLEEKCAAPKSTDAENSDNTTQEEIPVE